MEKAKKRIYACLIGAVLLAVVVGIIYYYYNVRDKGSMAEGTLITIQSGWERLMRHGFRK